MYVLDASAATSASGAEEQTLLAWAKALGRKGRVDEAVVLYRSVSDRSLRPKATAALASLLYTSSMTDAAHAAYPAAIARLEEIIALAPGTAAGAQAQQQLPIDQAGEARVLIGAGHATDAVALLDQVVDEGSAPATTTAASLYPAALLIAGQEEITQLSYKEAVVDLQRLVAKFPGTAQALQAQAMLTAPVAVSGTLVARSGAPEAGPVRLSMNYKAEPGGTYKTNGPFIVSAAKLSGGLHLPLRPRRRPVRPRVLLRGQLDHADRPGHRTAVAPGEGHRTRPGRSHVRRPATVLLIQAGTSRRLRTPTTRQTNISRTRAHRPLPDMRGKGSCL